jgi:hypothetical protein
MSIQQQDSETSVDELFEQVTNTADGKLRLKCKQCMEVFDHHKPSLINAHLKTKHPELAKVKFSDLSSFVRQSCLQQVQHMIGGPTCLSCKTILPYPTGSSLRQHLRECQDHNIELDDAQRYINIISMIRPSLQFPFPTPMTLLLPLLLRSILNLAPPQWLCFVQSMGALIPLTIPT